MAKIRFNIQPTSHTMSQLAKGVTKQGSKQWASRAMPFAGVISKEIGDMLVKTFEETPVAKALRGHGSQDLPAHFGLDDGTANGLVDGMAGLIRSSIQIISKGGSHTVSLRIQAVEKNWQEYLALPGAQYTSSPSNITVPVAQWLLTDPSIDIGQAAYDIVFKGENSKFDVRINKVSRSGRAIMVAIQSLGGGGGYVLPALVSGQAGGNFIEYALGQQNVARMAATILMKKVT